MMNTYAVWVYIKFTGRVGEIFASHRWIDSQWVTEESATKRKIELEETFEAFKASWVSCSASVIPMALQDGAMEESTA